jgi:hypothetical protein
MTVFFLLLRDVCFASSSQELTTEGDVMIRIFRSLVRLALVPAAVILGLVASAGLAQAYPFADSGAVGPYSVDAPIDCRHKVFGASSLLHMNAPGPIVLAKNFHAGGGNDAAWVRFRTFLVDHRTGQTLARNGWSDWVYAYDNRPARWTGSQFFSADARGMYNVQYRIEFWNQTSMVGWVADHSTTYNYYDNGNLGPIRMSACWRFR